MLSDHCTIQRGNGLTCCSSSSTVAILADFSALLDGQRPPQIYFEQSMATQGSLVAQKGNLCMLGGL